METVQAVQPQIFTDPPESLPHADDLCSGLTDETAEAGREGVEVEICPSATESELWDLRGPEPTHAEDQKYNSQVSLLLRFCVPELVVHMNITTWFTYFKD